MLHDGDALGVFCAELGVDEELDEVVLGRFLESLDGEALEPHVLFVVSLDYFSDELGERELTDEQLSRLLVLLDLSGGDGSLLGSPGLHLPLAGGG